MLISLNGNTGNETKTYVRKYYMYFLLRSCQYCSYMYAFMAAKILSVYMYMYMEINDSKKARDHITTYTALVIIHESNFSVIRGGKSK